MDVAGRPALVLALANSWRIEPVPSPSPPSLYRREEAVPRCDCDVLPTLIGDFSPGKYCKAPLEGEVPVRCFTIVDLFRRWTPVCGGGCRDAWSSSCTACHIHRCAHIVIHRDTHIDADSHTQGRSGNTNIMGYEVIHAGAGKENWSTLIRTIGQTAEQGQGCNTDRTLTEHVPIHHRWHFPPVCLEPI